MPVQIKLSISNLDDIKKALSLFPQWIIPELRKASSKSAFQVQREAKILTPVDTGRLRSSILTSLGIGPLAVGAKVSTNTEYAIFVHEGTKRMKGRPFLRQGVENSMQDIEGYFKDAVTNSLNRIQ